MSKIFLYLFVTLNLLFLAVLMALAVRDDSATSDEPPHILSGYVALKYGHDYIDPEHPLLAKALAASPLLFQDVKVNLSDKNYTVQKDGLDIGKMFDTSRSFLNYKGNNPDQILFATRLMMIFLTLFFGLIVFLLARKLFGDIAAALALFFYSTEPNIIANGSLFSTDLPATGFIITTIFALVHYAQRQTPKRLVFLILSLSAALLTKFSALYLAPIVVLLICLIYAQQKNRPYQHIVYLVLAVPIIISVFYGIISFRDRGLAGFLPITYLSGALEVLTSVSSKGRPTYLLGENYTGGHWYYFPIVIFAKTQLLTLLGFVIFLFAFLRKKIKLTKTLTFILFLPPLIFFFLALISQFNIGVRHVLPIYPFLIIFTASGFTFLLRQVQKSFSLGLQTAGLIILAVVLSRIWSIYTTYPHFLSYYNVVASGTDNGWKISGDSNYDWGQDVKRLSEYVRANNIKSIAFDNYTGLFSARDYYRLPVTKMSPKNKGYKGYLALSTSVIVYHQQFKDNYSWVVDNFQPIARAGKSIFIYKIP